MSEPTGKALAAIKGLQTVAFMLPAVLTGVAVGFVVSSYQPLALEDDSGASAPAVELETLDGNETSGEASVDTGDLSLDLSNIADGTYTGSAQGFQSTITVQVTVKDHKITAIEVLSQGDTAAYFNRAKAVIDEVLSAQSLDVDTVSGATYSSRGILMAIKNALGLASDEEANSGGGGGSTGSGKGSLDVDTDYTPGALKDGVYEGSGEGYNGDITVSVTISGGKITAIDIVSESDTDEYFNRAKGVIPSIISAQSTAVDTISGATYSSKGILAAVKEALIKAGANDSSDEKKDEEEKKDGEEKKDTEDNEDKKDNDTDDTTVKYADGDYTAYALCEYGGNFTPYYVGLTITVKDGKVTAIKDVHGTGKATDADEDLGEFDEDNESYLDKAINGRSYKGTTYTGVIEQLLNGKTSSNFDVVARATYSSKAIATAYDKALALSAAEYKKQNSTAACGCPGCTGENCCCTTNSGDTGGDSGDTGSDSSSDSGDSGSSESSGTEASGDGTSGTEGTGSDTSGGTTTSGTGGGSQ